MNANERKSRKVGGIEITFKSIIDSRLIASFAKPLLSASPRFNSGLAGFVAVDDHPSPQTPGSGDGFTIPLLDARRRSLPPGKAFPCRRVTWLQWRRSAAEMDFGLWHSNGVVLSVRLRASRNLRSKEGLHEFGIFRGDIVGGGRSGRFRTIRLIRIQPVPVRFDPSATVLFDFRADWCGPCRQMDSTVEQLIAAGYPVRRVNIDQDGDLANRFKVQGHSLLRDAGERPRSRSRGRRDRSRPVGGNVQPQRRFAGNECRPADNRPIFDRRTCQACRFRRPNPQATPTFDLHRPQIRLEQTTAAFTEIAESTGSGSSPYESLVRATRAAEH